ncbi:hypothetical protein BJV82DRAFT_603475 [Fennellomyces sp. T-0311]|nr:hypothetical protein BJV82DRAFT_603475 [Fennellomyces sp. T-0311]
MTLLIGGLPPEVVQSIFGLLELEQLVRCLRVCKEWHHILISLPWLWRRLELASRFQDSSEKYTNVLTTLIQRAGQHLRWLRLDVELSETFGIHALHLVAAHGCKYLEGLELNNTSGPEERLLLLRALRNMGSMPTMTFLQLYCLEISLPDVLQLFTLFPNLSYLDLSDSVIFDNGGVVSPVQIRVKDLTLNHIEGSSSPVFDCLIQSCPQLERFNCRGSQPSYDIISHLNRHVRSLKSLAYGVVRDYFPTPALETALASVILEQVGDQDLAAVVAHAYPTLSNMEIRSSFITDACVSQLASRIWPALRQIDLNTLCGITLQGLFVLLDACPRLEKLSFKNVRWWCITDSTLDRWAQYEHLVNIRYSGQLDEITPAAVRRLVDAKCAKLRNQHATLHLEFNAHTRIHIQFPTAVDTIIQ